MFDAVYLHVGLPIKFWKNNIANSDHRALTVKGLMPLDDKGVEKAIEKVGLADAG